MGAIRVLHSVTKYLNLTENWIEPQVFRVPGAEGRVICESRVNQDAFITAADDVIVDPAPEGWQWRIQSYLSDRSARRGVNHFAAELRVRRWSPQIVHGHFGPRAWHSLNLAGRLGLPLLTSFYGYDAWMAPRIEPVWQTRYERLFDAGVQFLVEGPAMRERLIAIGCPSSKVRIHRIGVDLARLAFRERDFAPSIRVAMVGRFVEKKGLVDGLRACARAREEGARLSVTVVGDAVPGDAPGERIGTQLRGLAEEPDLAGHVRFTGFLSADETSAILRSHDVLLCPSRRAANGDAEGGAPVVLTEAMAQGLYCIGSRHCDIPELIIDGRTGTLCDEGHVEGLAGALIDVSRDPAHVIRMTRAARSHVETHYSLETQLTALGRVYQALA